MNQTQSPIDRIYEIIQREGLEGLTEGELGLYSIYWFVSETQNGGVHQFFFNDSGQLATSALRYLEVIGASKTALVLRQAIAMFPDGKVPAELGKRRQLLEEMEEQDVSFGPLTNELFKTKEDVNNLHRTYAAAHPELFARVRSPVGQ